MAQSLVDELQKHLETFLHNWTEHMRSAGYLAHTTAKRQDCIDSFQGVLEAIKRMPPAEGVPEFAPMLEHAERGAHYLIQTARNHRLRGITEGMFLGCFKTLIHSLEDIVLALEMDAEQKLQAILKIRRVSDVLETAFVGDWEQSLAQDMTQQLQEVNRRLTLKKCRYENIYNSTSDLVVLTDADGTIIEVNPEADKYLEADRLVGQPFWQFLAMDGDSMTGVLAKWPADVPHEVSSRDGGNVFILRIVPLERVSLAASQEHMLILNDITLLVDHRKELEHRVEERTAELKQSQEQLREDKAQIGAMNVTLKQVMKSIESDRRESEQKISEKIRTHLLPALDKVRHEKAEGVRTSYLDLVQEQLIALTAGFDTELDASMLKLSRTEIRICRFIQAGCSSKEISEAMNLAFDTIRTHRKNIRRKLGLQGKDVNLHTFLASRNCTPGMES